MSVLILGVLTVFSRCMDYGFLLKMLFLGKIHYNEGCIKDFYKKTFPIFFSNHQKHHLHDTLYEFNVVASAKISWWLYQPNLFFNALRSDSL